MENLLSKDSDWSVIDGRICEVLRFMPFATVEGGMVISTDRTMPYALVAISCNERGVKLPAETVGAITHKDDFKRLWAAFVERGVSNDEKVVIMWSKKEFEVCRKIHFPIYAATSRHTLQI